MSRKQFTLEQIIAKLREAEVELSRGRSVAEVCRKIGVTDQTYYRWRLHHNRLPPPSALDYRPPAPEAVALIMIPIWTETQSRD